MRMKKQRPIQPLLVSIEDASDMLGVGRSTIYELIAAGELAVVPIGRRRLVRVAELQRFIEAHTEAA